MTNDESTTRLNPYSPPTAKGSSSLPARVGSFVVGTEQRLVEVFWSSWSGLEVYTVDGVEVLRTKNYQVRGTREFDAGPHHVVIKIDALLRLLDLTGTPVSGGLVTVGQVVEPGTSVPRRNSS